MSGDGEDLSKIQDVPACLRCWLSKEEREKPDERPRWMGRWTFILAAIGSAIGLGNFWRFPFLTFKHGGAQFFFPWATCLFVMGIPFMIMELALGQKFQRGDIAVFRGIDHRLVGVGVISVYSSYVFSWYYNVIVAWALVYAIAGFLSPLPWAEKGGNPHRCLPEISCDKIVATECDKEEGDPSLCDGAGLPKACTAVAADILKEEAAGIDFDKFFALTENCSGTYTNDEGVEKSKCKLVRRSLAEEFYRIDVIRIMNDDCVEWEDGKPTDFSTRALGATFATWVIIFMCVWKGVKSSSWIVWITVPLPLVFVFVMIANNAMLPGSETGIDRYFSGNTENPTEASEQWSDAAGQIFLGLSVCLGIMTSYGSYNPKEKPIIMDSVIISISNCSFSFIAGFAVWLVVGYLDKIGKLDEGKVAGVSLAFITYPTAIDTMSAPNFWAVVLGLTLFLLGLDSSFSAIEATSTVICDTAWKGKAPRMFIAFMLCLLGFLGSMPFCFNWGFILFDVVDHYLCAYLLLIIGILQAFGCGWFFDAADIMARSEDHRKSMLILGFGYWILLLIIGTATMIADNAAIIGFATFIGLFLVVAGVSFYISKLSFKRWYQDILMCGVRRIGYACSQMGRADPLRRMWWETYFVFYWGLLIKFLNPMLLYFITISILVKDIRVPYGGYSTGWQVVGWLIPALGLIMFIVATVMFGEPDMALDYSEFILNEEAAKGITYGPAGTKGGDKQKEVEMAGDATL